METKMKITSMLLVFVLGITNFAYAQQSQSDPGKALEPYTVSSTIELGVRGISVDGNATKYRSDLNYDPGFRLFNSSLLMEANGTSGKLFDSLMVNSYGWGGDPNQYLRINVEKDKWYRFDANYRHIDYVNSLSNLALQQHTSNTTLKLGDFDLTILPKNRKVSFNVGYSLARNNGDGTITYDYARDEFPVLSPTRIDANDYRVGAEGKLWVLDLSFQQGWRYTKEDTRYFIEEPNVGNNPLNQSALTTFERDFPMRGRTSYSRFNLHTNIKNRVDITGRYVYQSSTAEFGFIETITGKDFSGNNVLLDRFTINGDSKRPNGIGDFAVTGFVTDRLRLSNTFSINAFRITGGHLLNEILDRTRANQTPLPLTRVDTLIYRKTFYRRALNTVEASYDFHPRFGAYIGHRYSDRRIELEGIDENLNAPSEEPPSFETFDNRTNTIFWGFRAKPLKLWTLYFDMERGEADNVFTRVDNYDFTNLRVRTMVKPTNKLTVHASLLTRDNTNPSMIEGTPPREFGVDVNSRIFTTAVDWMPNGNFSLSSGYTHTHLTSQAVVLFFLLGQSQEGQSRYFVKDNYAYVNLFVRPESHVSLFATYAIHHDAGQQDREALDPKLLLSSFPYQYQTSGFRASVKLHRRVDWVVGYQYSDYQDRYFYDFIDPTRFGGLRVPNVQKYQAHQPFTSLKFYFGGAKRE